MIVMIKPDKQYTGPALYFLWESISCYKHIKLVMWQSQGVNTTWEVSGTNSSHVLWYSLIQLATWLTWYTYDKGYILII